MTALILILIACNIVAILFCRLKVCGHPSGRAEILAREGRPMTERSFEIISFNAGQHPRVDAPGSLVLPPSSCESGATVQGLA